MNIFLIWEFLIRNNSGLKLREKIKSWYFSYNIDFILTSQDHFAVQIVRPSDFGNFPGNSRFFSSKTGTPKKFHKWKIKRERELSVALCNDIFLNFSSYIFLWKIFRENRFPAGIRASSSKSGNFPAKTVQMVVLCSDQSTVAHQSKRFNFFSTKIEKFYYFSDCVMCKN